jgi:hypothetical protein
MCGTHRRNEEKKMEIVIMAIGFIALAVLSLLSGADSRNVERALQTGKRISML